MAPWFRDAEDARSYLTEVGRLWLVWIATLALLFLFQQWWALLAIGAGFLLGIVVLGRPLQERAQRVADPDAMTGSALQTALGKNRKRDMALRRLMYGEAPLREAIALTGTTSLLIWVRRLILVATAAAFVWVMVGLFSAPT